MAPSSRAHATFVVPQSNRMHLRAMLIPPPRWRGLPPEPLCVARLVSTRPPQWLDSRRPLRELPAGNAPEAGVEPAFTSMWAWLGKLRMPHEVLFLAVYLGST